MPVERTLVLLKPETLQRGIVGEVISRFERRGLKIVALKMLWMDRDLAERHYAAHKGKDFYEPLIEYITSSPLIAMVLEGDEAIEVVRNMAGSTDCREAEPGTIRGDFGLSTQKNIVHASDSSESAEREIALFFSPEEIHDYDLSVSRWLK